MSEYQKSLPISLFISLAESSNQAVALFCQDSLSNDFLISFCNSAFKNLFKLNNANGYAIASMSASLDNSEDIQSFLKNSVSKPFKALVKLKETPYECYNFVIQPYIEFRNSFYMVTLKPEHTSEEYLTKPLFKGNASFPNNAEFMSNLSHDLRTPLNAILGFSDLMRSETFGPINNEKYKNYLDDIFESSQNLLSTIDDVLEIADEGSGVDDDPLGPYDEAVDIISMVEMTYKSLKSKFIDKKIAVTLSSPNQIIELMADEPKLQHSLHCILCHILNTALNGSSLKITTSCSTDYGITLKYALKSPARLNTAVKDMKADVNNVVGSHHYAAQAGNISLSLSLAKKHLKTHGGDIIAEKEKDDLTIIVAQLPISRLSAVDSFSPTPVSLDS